MQKEINKLNVKEPTILAVFSFYYKTLTFFSRFLWPFLLNNKIIFLKKQSACVLWDFMFTEQTEWGFVSRPTLFCCFPYTFCLAKIHKYFNQRKWLLKYPKIMTWTKKQHWIAGTILKVFTSPNLHWCILQTDSPEIPHAAFKDRTRNPAVASSTIEKL